jgi:protein disulfide-isomerase A6
VILVTDKKVTPTLFKALSIEYLDRLVFGEVKSSSKDIADELQVSSFPSLIVYTKEGEKIVYDGAIKQEQVVRFLDQYALPSPKSTKNRTEKKEKPTKKVQKPTTPCTLCSRS